MDAQSNASKKATLSYLCDHIDPNYLFDSLSIIGISRSISIMYLIIANNIYNNAIPYYDFTEITEVYSVPVILSNVLKTTILTIATKDQHCSRQNH